MEDLESICQQAIDKMVEEIANQVVKRICDMQNNILVVYTGAKIGCAEATRALGELRETHGLSYKVLISDSAAEVLDVEAIDRALLPEELWIGKANVPGAQLAREANLVVVPALSASTCAHVANILTDTPAQEAICEAIMLGRKVIAAVDGCCPDNSMRQELGFAFPEAMASRMRANRDALGSYGVRLTSAAKIGKRLLEARDAAVWGLLGASSAPAEEVQACEPAAAPVAAASTTVRASGRVLSATQVRSLEPGSTLVVPAGTLVTDYARDAAKYGNVTLVEEGR